MDIFLRVWSVVETEAREGKGVDEAVVLPHPASAGLSQGVAHWPKWGALGLGNSSVSSWTMRRHTKPCLSLYLFRSFFFFFPSIKSNRLEPLLLGEADEFAKLPLRPSLSASSSSVASLSTETEARWLQRLVGSDVSEPRRIIAGTTFMPLLLPFKFEVLELSTSSLLLREVAWIVLQLFDCSREVAGCASLNLLIAETVIAYHSAS